MEKGTKTRYPGVYRLSDGWRVRKKIRDPRTGREREFERKIQATDACDAAVQLAELARKAVSSDAPPERQRLNDSAPRWLASRAAWGERTETVNAGRLALLLPAIGDLYPEQVQRSDVQQWATEMIADGYSVATVQGCLRVLRQLLADLDAPTGCTTRISLPEHVPLPHNEATAEQVAAFMAEMWTHWRRHFALVEVMADTGLRFCHASALAWDDLDREAGTITVRRKNVLGKPGPVSRRKRAPERLPLTQACLATLEAHRQWMLKVQHPGLASGWMFPARSSRKGGAVGLRVNSSSLDRAWQACKEAAKIEGRFLVHDLRRRATDDLRAAGVDPIVRQSITAHTPEMQEHYSQVRLEEQRKAVEAARAARIRLAGKEGA